MEKESWQKLLRKARAHVGLGADDDDDDEYECEVKSSIIVSQGNRSPF
jgi:hypothetical protein